MKKTIQRLDLGIVNQDCHIFKGGKMGREIHIHLIRKILAVNSILINPLLKYIQQTNIIEDIVFKMIHILREVFMEMEI